MSQPTKTKRRTSERILETIAAGFTEPTTFLKSPTSAIEKVRARKRRIKAGDMKELQKVNREILTKGVTGVGTALLGGTAVGRKVVGAVVPKLIPTTPVGILGATTGAGILLTSKRSRQAVGEFTRDPLRFGAETGEIIEKAVEGKELPGVKEALLGAGIVGAGIVGGVAAKKGAEKLFSKEPKVLTPSQVQSSIALPSDGIPDALTPISDAPVVATTPEPKPTPASVPAVNVKVINKPQVNVANAQSI